MDDEYSRLLKRKAELQEKNEKAQKLRQLRGEVYKLENPRKVALVNALLTGGKRLLTPQPQDARKAKLKKKVASVSDINKALDPLMKL